VCGSHQPTFDSRRRLLFAFHQHLDDVRVGQRGRVADLVHLVLGNLAQDAAHDFARARLRQRRRELDFVGHSDGADFLADMQG